MRGTIPRFAVIPTHNRPDELAQLVYRLSKQCDGVVIIDNASAPPVYSRMLHDITAWELSIAVIRDPEQPPNLSRLWNIGLNAVKLLTDFNSDDFWDVAIFNDDAVVPRDWWDDVSSNMRKSPAIIACRPGHRTNELVLKTEPDANMSHRMCGWAFMMRGELGLRANESLRWWFGDTDLDWQARRAGGMLLVPGEPVGNTYANQSTTGVLADQAGQDRETFIDKWGWTPW